MVARVLTVTKCPPLQELQAAENRKAVPITAIGTSGEETIYIFPKRVTPPDGWSDEIVVQGGCGKESGTLRLRTKQGRGVITLTPYWP